MKKIIMLIALVIPLTGIAVDYRNMSEADMQRMMQGMKAAQACMQEMDMAKMQAFGEQAKEVEAEIASLCADGKRDAAMARGMAFAKQVNSDPEIGKMRECSKKMQGMMPPMPALLSDANSGKSGKHICDE